MSEEMIYTFENPEYRKTFWHTSSQEHSPSQWTFETQT